MTIDVSSNNKELNLTPVGRLDSTTSADFEQVILDNFTDEYEKLVIDFNDVDFISSKGLRVIVATYKNLGNRKMEIINANASVLEVFKLSGLLKVIDAK